MKVVRLESCKLVVQQRAPSRHFILGENKMLVQRAVSVSWKSCVFGELLVGTSVRESC